MGIYSLYIIRFVRLKISRHCCLLFLFLLFFIQARTQNVIKDSVSIIAANSDPAKTVKDVNTYLLHFIKPADNRINFGLSGCEFHYIILKLNAPQSLYNQYLSIDNTSLDTVQIYRINKNANDKLLYLGGQLVPFDTQRDYAWHTIPLEINDSPSYYCIAVKASQKNINIRYQIMDGDNLLQHYQVYDRIVFFYIGIAFMIAAIIVLAFFLFKKPVFAAYLAYMLCISVWIVAHYGKIFPFLYPRMPVLNQVVKPLSSLGAGLFLLMVLQLVFAHKLAHERVLTKIIQSMRIVLFVTMVCMLSLLFPALKSMVRAVLITLWHIELLFLIALIIFIPFHFIKAGSIARIFSVAMFVICVMSLMQLFANSGFIKSYFLNEHGMALGSLLENSIMAFGLFYSLLEERKIKELRVIALEAEQTAILKKLLLVQDKERKRIAEDLHDNIGPLLAALKINFRRIVHVKEKEKQLELVQKTETIIDDSIVEIRNVAHNLMPKSLSSKGLINTLSGYFEDIEQLYSKTIVFSHNVQSIFEPELQMNIYRIISELVLNAAKHSHAKIINVSIQSDARIVFIAIDDNGQGFECKEKGIRKSLGIQSAESRIHYLKGKFCLQSEPGKGTTVHIEIPL
jgi:signal transduction histidine kinase